MLLIDELRNEHLLIERVAGSLQTFAERRVRGEGKAEDGNGFLKFFLDFAGRYHHGREEDILFPALIAEAELPAERGPIPALLQQHEEMARMLREIAPLLTLEDASKLARLPGLARDYSRLLWQHIDAENSVLFPESEERLRWSGVKELPDRPPDDLETAARATGEGLAGSYPPLNDPEALRGEGCVICPSYGISCEGIEREWWSDSEWETFSGRSG